MRLAGKTALVTAAAAGIGRAMAVTFAREGARVIAADIDAANLKSLVESHAGIQGEVLDVTDPTAIEELSRRTPRVNVLVNAVGFVHNGTILACSDADWSKS